MVIAVQSMPTVAIAPLIVVYFGVDLPSKLVTVALLCFFPVFVNTVAGLTSADSHLLDLYRANGASRWRTLIDVKVPSAADFIPIEDRAPQHWTQIQSVIEQMKKDLEG